MTFRLCPQLILLALVFPALGLASVQDQPLTKDVETKLLTGVIASIDESCSSFVLLQQEGSQKTETTLHRDPRMPAWSSSADGCSFVPSSGDEFLLRTGLPVTVRYVKQGVRNLVLNVEAPNAEPVAIVVAQGPPSRNCQPEPDSQGRQLYKVACKGVSPPVCDSCTAPPYTEEARAAHLEGSVLMVVTILPDGSTADVRLLRGLDKGLDESAISTVKKWRFNPILGPEGEPVSVRIPIEVTFRLLERKPS